MHKLIIYVQYLPHRLIFIISLQIVFLLSNSDSQLNSRGHNSIKSYERTFQDLTRCENYGEMVDMNLTVKKILDVCQVVLLCCGKYFKGFKPTIARMVTRLEFRLYTGNVLGLTVQLMHIERQEVCYAPVLSCGNA